MAEPAAPVAHRARIVPRPKMDASELVAAVCSCGKYTSSPGTPTDANRSFQAHANSMAARDFPEHERLAKVSERSQAIGAFLDSVPYRLCWLVCTHCGSTPVDRTRDGSEHCCRRPSTDYAPVHKSIQTVLAEYFGIDQDKLEWEKRVMLYLLREANGG